MFFEFCACQQSDSRLSRHKPKSNPVLLCVYQHLVHKKEQCESTRVKEAGTWEASDKQTGLLARQVLIVLPLWPVFRAMWSQRTVQKQCDKDAWRTRSKEAECAWWGSPHCSRQASSFVTCVGHAIKASYVFSCWSPAFHVLFIFVLNTVIGL